MFTELSRKIMENMQVRWLLKVLTVHCARQIPYVGFLVSAKKRPHMQRLEKYFKKCFIIYTIFGII